ncbi:MAG: hypothetical protein JST47_16245 [Bacteroidetes bacterium]|nr:hypothetical protein [Bacteroidota bacterium]
MDLNDLLPYFELYKNLKSSGEDTVLNEKLAQQEKEFINKEISLAGIVDEIDIPKNELVISYHDKNKETGKLHGLISNHFFIFCLTDGLNAVIEQSNIQKDDWVKVSGTIISVHRNSVLRLQLSSVSVLKKNVGILKKDNRKGCFIATSVYGSHEAVEVQKFYTFRDEVLSKTFAGRIFIKIYYSISPAIAKWADDKPVVKSFIKKQILDKILKKM